jgi:ribose 5-phosphate isomerase A
MNQEEAKRLAAREALERLPDSGVIGLGTGSTARFFIEGVGQQVRLGKDWRGVPTSEESRRLARELGIPLLDDDGPWNIDVCVDGADEVDDQLDVIKGGGGAHTREKIVNQHSRWNIIIVDQSKVSRRLGEKHPVPVEVLKYAHRSTARALEQFGEPTLRMKGGMPFETDSGQYLYDLKVSPIDKPHELEQALCSLPGVVDVGLFCGRVDLIIVAGSEGIVTFG